MFKTSEIRDVSQPSRADQDGAGHVISRSRRLHVLLIMSILFMFSSVVQMMSRPVITPNPEGKLNGIPQEKSTNLNRVKDTNLMDVKGIVCTSNVRVSR